MNRRRISSLTIAALLVAVSGSIIAGSRAEAAVPRLYYFYWQEGDAPKVMWPTDKGYCFLTQMAFAENHAHKVGISVSGGNWVLSGTGFPGEGGSLFGVAACVPFPAGYSRIDPVWTTISSQGAGQNLGSNANLCSLAGANYNGDRHGNAPQWQSGLYPATSTSVSLRATVTNDGTYPPPYREIAAQCIRPTNAPSLYWGPSSNDAPNQTIKTFSGHGTIMTGANSLCVPGTYIPVSGASGFQLHTDDAGANWKIYSPFSGDYISFRCFDYGPVVQMDIGSGSILTEALGPDWAADASFSGGEMYSTGNTIVPGSADKPAPMALYQNVRSAVSGTFSYTFSGYAASSPHKVRLHFAEAWFTASGQRKFDVSLNGTKVLANFDVVASAGGANRANVQTFNVNATAGGQITILFARANPVVSNPIVSGIEIQ